VAAVPIASKTKLKNIILLNEQIYYIKKIKVKLSL
jgi:hypothetical protein